MNFNSPNIEPKKTFEKFNTKKSVNKDIDLEPKQKLNNKPKNKIERPKIDLNTQSRNKIEPRKIDTNMEPRHKLQPRLIDPKTAPRHRIEPRKIDPDIEPRYKFQPRKINPKAPSINKIESPKNDINKEPKNKIGHQRYDINNLNIDKSQVNSSHKIKIKEIDEKILIKSFPKKSRNIICEEIYKNFEKNTNISNSKIVEKLSIDLKGNISHPKWISKIPTDELEELRIKMVNSDINNGFQSSFLKYFDDLANLVKDIKYLNKENKNINFSEVSRNLITQNRGLNLTKRGLEEAISGVYSHFKNNFNDFKLERAKRKPITGTESEKESIRCLRKEYKLLIEMNNGSFGGKCSNPDCDTDFKRLPAFDFHHKQPQIKTILWSEIMHKKYDEIKNTLEAQKVKPICKNCHLPDNANIFKDFKDLILKKDLFTYSSSDIDRIINSKLDRYIEKNHPSYTAASLKFEVKKWIKKRSVFEQVFNGKCISCGEDRLPSLQTHHTNQDLKVHKWGNVSRSWNIKELINDFIIEEECVCLCGNCHAMISTKNFEKNIIKVLGDKYVQEVRADYNNIKTAINKDIDRIKKIKNGIVKLKVKDYLKED